MTKLSLVALVFFAVLLVSDLRADEQTRYRSPDGMLALRGAYPEDESAEVESGIVELSTHKVLLDLHGPGRPYIDEAKLVWSADSQRVAFFEPNRRGGLTRVFFRSGTSFQEIELPTLPEPKTSKKVPASIRQSRRSEHPNKTRHYMRDYQQ